MMHINVERPIFSIQILNAHGFEEEKSNHG